MATKTDRDVADHRLGDADHLTITFLFTMSGKESRYRIAATRVNGAPANLSPGPLIARLRFIVPGFRVRPM